MMGRRLALVTVVAAALLGFVGQISSASAAATSPWWHLISDSNPTYLQPEIKEQIVVTATNLGDADAGGGAGPITITDVLPPGVKAVSITPGCELSSLTCVFNGPVPPYGQIEMRIDIEVDQSAESGELNRVRISGGGAPSMSFSKLIVVSGEQIPFGLQDNELALETESGTSDTQAGSHPFQLTNTLVLNRRFESRTGGFHQGFVPVPAALAKDIDVKLPPGLVGNPSPVPRCTLPQFLTLVGGQELTNRCPMQAAIGVAIVKIYEPGLGTLDKFTVPVFNLEPSFGEPARFGFLVAEGDVPVFLNTSLRSGNGEDYGITVSSPNITQTANFLSTEITFWGTPADPRHDDVRGWECLLGTENGEGHGPHAPCQPLSAQYPQALLTLPTSCSGSPLPSTALVSSWADPDMVTTVPITSPTPTMDGCNRLPFAPSIEAEPTSDNAMTSTGLSFDLYFDDEGLTSPEGLAQSQVAKTVVSLPVGVTTNPSVAAGLSACSRTQYESENLASTTGSGCPSESKIGTVEIESPLITQKIDGSVYLAKQGENPFGSLLALYVVAKNPELGVMIRVAGKVEPDPVTGQLVTTFEDIPQLPFDHFHFAFRQGQRAPLATPAACGTYTTTADLTPYSNPGNVVRDTAAFTIATGPGGGPCPRGGNPPFNPVVTAGTVNNAAASYSPMYLQVKRQDTEQEITRFSAELPPGLTANLSGIPFCPDADIALAKTKSGAQEEVEPSCPAASQIGHTEVGVGVGETLAWTAGKLYFAGPYNGAPFSVVAINSAKVGPFDLGTVVVREALSINPETGVVTVDAKASDPIPHILDGIVIHARDIRVYVDRPGFSINPTSCAPMTFAATVDGAGADPSNPADQVPVTIDDRFQAADCANLNFKPDFKVATSGKTSRRNGASLSVKLTMPGALGRNANIRSVKVDLPKQLPSRLTTLQKACTEQQFAVNPAGCPAASRIGIAKAVTPILPVPLVGPAYFVSHGGAKFPELIIVLQGYGVTIDLRGETFINKEGITSSTFRAIPDEPVGSFELTLPEGADSALAANGSFCSLTKTVLVKRKVKLRSKGGTRTVTRKVRKTVPGTLVMPTAFTAQNGAVIRQSTPIEVTGCGRASKANVSKLRKHPAKGK